MTDEQMQAMTRALVGDPRFDDVIETYIDLAKGAVVQRLFPFEDKDEWDKVPHKHHARTCEIAAYLINRRGAEGETSHSENGVSRSYECAGIPASYFDGMTPMAGIPA